LDVLKYCIVFLKLDVVVPEEYRKTFEPLCHDCPENSFKNVKHSIESSLGVPLEETFSSKKTQVVPFNAVNFFDRIQ